MFTLRRAGFWPWPFVIAYGNETVATIAPHEYSTRDDTPEEQLANRPATQQQYVLLQFMVATANEALERDNPFMEEYHE